MTDTSTETVSNVSYRNVQMVPVDDLVAHPQNPRHGDLRAVTESLKAHGQYRPIVANIGGVIVAGHHLWTAAKELGWTEVAVAWVDLSPEDHIRVMLVDNRTSDLAKNNHAGIVSLLLELAETDAGLLGTGYDDSMLEDRELPDPLLTTQQQRKVTDCPNCAHVFIPKTRQPLPDEWYDESAVI